MTRRQAIIDTVHRYWDLGFISFGGPGVHVIILRKRFVDTVKWLDSKTFIDLFALGNALPGPGSTQLAFSIAVVRHGVWAGLLAFLLWSLPGAIGMAGLAVGISRIPDTLPSIVLALLTGLNAAAVGLIALAAFQLANAAGTDGITIIWLWLSASFGICYHAPWMYPTLIVAGGLSTLVWDFRRQWITQPLRRKLGRSQREQHSGALGEGDGDGEQVEMRDMPTTASETPPSVTSGTSNAPPESPSEDKSGSATDRPPSITTAPAPSDSNGMRQRNPAPDVEPASPVAAPESSPLKVVSVRVAIALLIGFVLFLTIPLATRAGLQNAGKDVPRALDVSADADANHIHVRADSHSSSAT
jgi:chromate transport protein ChrA